MGDYVDAGDLVRVMADQAAARQRQIRRWLAVVTTIILASAFIYGLIVRNMSRTLDSQSQVIAELSDTLNRRSVVLDYQRCQTRYVLALVNLEPETPESITELANAQKLLDRANRVDITKEDMPVCIEPDN